MNEIGYQITNAIARRLVAFGYPSITGDLVKSELAKPKKDRSIIGRFAADMLSDYGINDKAEDE